MRAKTASTARFNTAAMLFHRLLRDWQASNVASAPRKVLWSIAYREAERLIPLGAPGLHKPAPLPQIEVVRSRPEPSEPVAGGDPSPDWRGGGC